MCAEVILRPRDLTPVWRAYCYAAAEYVDLGVHRLRSADRRRRADGCCHHGDAIPAEPSSPSTSRRCGAGPVALALRPAPGPPLRAATDDLRPVRLCDLKLCRGAQLLGAPAHGTVCLRTPRADAARCSKNKS